MYNMKLSGGLHAGKFTDIGRVRSIKTCVRYCCSDATACDLAFMLGKRLVLCETAMNNLISVKNVKIVCYVKGSLTLRLQTTFFLSEKCSEKFGKGSKKWVHFTDL